MNTMNSAQSLAQRYQAQCHADLAGRKSMAALLNCYCREVAAPAGQLQWDLQFGQKDWPLALKHEMQVHQAHLLQLQLPLTHGRVLIAVRRPSATLNFDYLSDPYGKSFGRGWQQLDWYELSSMLLAELAARFGQPFNDELLEQIGNSVAIMEAFVAGTALTDDWGAGRTGYLTSEQALPFGHAFHPTPKSRQGIELAAIRRYSPELGAGFPLHYFAVRQQDIRQQSLLAEQGTDLINRQLPDLFVPRGYQAIPVHPWQAGHIRSLAEVQAALASGRLLDLGRAGKDYYPTASVRTLFEPDSPWFYKCSLHVRLTNCVRKNAYYELESAVFLNGLLQQPMADLQARFPDMTLLAEPAFITVDFSEQDQPARTRLMEAFGLIVRQNLPWHAQETPMLAGALFGDQVSGTPQVRVQVERWAARAGLDYAAAATEWFGRYVELLAQPMLYALCHHGVVFEPHLQNVVIGLVDGKPSRLYLRDLEGTKLVPSCWPAERLDGLSERARQSVYYPPEQAWNRVAYCLFINNFCQAVFYLAGADAGLEAALWQTLADSLERYQQRHGNDWSAELIGRVLAGEPWPNKTNLLNRVLKRADRQSEYVPLANPLRRPAGADPRVAHGQPAANTDIQED